MGFNVSVSIADMLYVCLSSAGYLTVIMTVKVSYDGSLLPSPDKRSFHLIHCISSGTANLRIPISQSTKTHLTAIPFKPFYRYPSVTA